MSKELTVVDLNAKDFGIDQKQEEDLMSDLPQILSERSLLVPQYEEIIKLDIDDENTIKRASELRKKIQKNRTQGINVWHKNAKDFFLKGGNFCDAIKRKEISVNQRMEDTLLEIEKHQERKIEEARKLLQSKRELLISKFMDDADKIDLASMDDEVFDAYLVGKKASYTARIEKEKQEKRREAERKKEELRVKRENAELKRAAEEQARKAAKEKAENEKRLKAIEDEKIEQERQRQAKHDAEMAEIRKEKEKAERELQAKRDAEIESQKLEEKERQNKLNASDTDKVDELIKSLEMLKTNYSFKSRKNQKMFIHVCLLIDKIIVFISK